MHDRFANLHPTGQLILVPRDKEQGVVDPHAKPDHGRDRWPDAGDAEEMPHEPDD